MEDHSKNKVESTNTTINTKGGTSTVMIGDNNTVNNGIPEGEYIKELKSHIADLQKQLEKGSLSDMERQTLVKALKETQDQLETERTIRRQMEEYQRKNPNLSEHQNQAYKLLQEGKKEEALQLLDDAILEEQGKQLAGLYVTKAQTLLLGENKNFPEAEKNYLRAVEIYPSFDNLHTFALFYNVLRRDYSKAELYYNRSLEKASDDSERAMALNSLGNLHSEGNQYEKAEGEYAESLSICRRLATSNPEAYEADVATTLNNWGNLHRNVNQYEKAEREYVESLSIRRWLAKSNPEVYEAYVATTLNNLGNLHSDNQYEKAEGEYVEALSIYRRLAKSNPEAYEADVATTLNNLGNLHSEVNQCEKAEEELSESLSIRRRLAKSNPEAYEADVAGTLNNLGSLHRDVNQYEKAEKGYVEALSIHRRLTKSNPEAYEADMARTLNNLGALHCDVNQYEKAEGEFSEALNIYQRLAQSNPAVYNPKVEMMQHNLSKLHQAKNR
jgi:tetratricopeptide (TPR) repeat protein